MTLAETLHPNLSKWRPTDRQTLTENLGDWTIDLTADHNDVVGVLVWELALTRNGPAPDGTTVNSWAHAVAARSSGLLERLKVLEIDSTRDEAVLRSDSPSQKGELIAYYELKLSSTTTANVRRYEANRSAGTPRVQTPFAVTHEVLAKLLRDITS